MIFDLTNAKEETIKRINELVGQSFPFFERLKLGGIGSERLLIQDASQSIRQFLKEDPALDYCNLELRPLGVIVHMHDKGKNIGWVIPYRKLNLHQQDNGLKLYCDADFIQLQKVFHGSNVDKFIKKMMKFRATYLNSIKLSGY